MKDRAPIYGAAQGSGLQVPEKRICIKFKRLDFGTLAGKQLRGKLLVRLKKLSGLMYSEIVQLLEFHDIKL